MNDDRTLERAARSWVEEGPTRAPERAVEAALSRIQTTAQERDLVPWRLPTMPRTARWVASLAAIAVVVAIGLYALRSPSTVAPPGPSPSPSLAPSVAPDTSRAFTSTMHGYQLGYPATWAVTPATALWPVGAEAPSAPSDQLDVFIGPAAGQTFVVVSQPLGSTTSDAWLAAYEQSAPQMPPACWPAPSDMEKTTISGQPAWVHGGIPSCGFTEAIVFAGGRVYEVTGYNQPNGVFNRALFDAIAATIVLKPASALDVPPPSVSDAACRLLQAAEVDAASPGYEGLGAIPGPGGTGAVTTCVYTSGGGDIQARLTLTNPGGPAAFEVAKAQAGVQTISDLGVPAVFNPNTLTLSILKGDAMVAIVPSFLATNTEQRIAMASAMARLIVTRL